MLQLSKYPYQTEKTILKDSDNLSTWFLSQARFINQVNSWVYDFLPMWLRVIRNIEKIIRKNIENSWAT